MTLAAVGRGWGGPTYKRPVICSSGRQLSYHASHAQDLRVLAVHGISVRVSINTAVFSSVKTRALRQQVEVRFQTGKPGSRSSSFSFECFLSVRSAAFSVNQQCLLLLLSVSGEA